MTQLGRLGLPVLRELGVHELHDLVDRGEAHALLSGHGLDKAVDALDVWKPAVKRTCG